MSSAKYLFLRSKAKAMLVEQITFIIKIELSFTHKNTTNYELAIR